MQTALTEVVAANVAAGNLGCLNQPRLVASLMLSCSGADAEAAQFVLDEEANNAIADGLIHPSPTPPILI